MRRMTRGLAAFFVLTIYMSYWPTIKSYASDSPDAKNIQAKMKIDKLFSRLKEEIAKLSKNCDDQVTINNCYKICQEIGQDPNKIGVWFALAAKAEDNHNEQIGYLLFARHQIMTWQKSRIQENYLADVNSRLSKSYVEAGINDQNLIRSDQLQVSSSEYPENVLWTPKVKISEMADLVSAIPADCQRLVCHEGELPVTLNEEEFLSSFLKIIAMPETLTTACGKTPVGRFKAIGTINYAQNAKYLGSGEVEKTCVFSADAEVMAFLANKIKALAKGRENKILGQTFFEYERVEPLTNHHSRDKTHTVRHYARIIDNVAVIGDDPFLAARICDNLRSSTRRLNRSESDLLKRVAKDCNQDYSLAWTRTQPLYLYRSGIYTPGEVFSTASETGAEIGGALATDTSKICRFYFLNASKKLKDCIKSQFAPNEGLPVGLAVLTEGNFTTASISQQENYSPAAELMIFPVLQMEYNL
jgi:hypothetical protein